MKNTARPKTPQISLYQILRGELAISILALAASRLFSASPPLHWLATYLAVSALLVFLLHAPMLFYMSADTVLAEDPPKSKRVTYWLFSIPGGMFLAQLVLLWGLDM